MSYEKITFVDRIAEYPTRRKLTTIDTQQTFGTYDVSRDEGTVSQEGTALNAATFNALQANVESAFVEVDNNIASAYDATATYAEGDFCIYDGVLYQANQDIETAEAWDSTHWDSVKLTDIMGTGSASIDDTVVASDKTWSSEHIVSFLPEDSVSGAIASFTDGANNIPCPSVLCTINPVQDLHGQDYPYPSGGGKNKVDITINTSTTSGRWNFSSPMVGTFTISAKNNSVVTTENVWRCDIIYQDGTHKYAGDSGYTYAFPQTVTSTSENPIVAVAYRNYGMTSGSYNVQFESGSSATPYAPYSNICPITGHTELNLVQKDGNDTVVHTYTTDLGTTVYGGTLDVVSGVLTVDKVALTFADLNFSNSSPESHVFRGNYNGTYYSSMKFPSSQQVATEDITEQYKAMAFSPISASDNGKFALAHFTDSQVARFVFIDNNYSTLSDFTTARNNDKIIITLATPITTQLTPQEVKSLLGSNNIYHDCNGQVAVTYRADIGLYIDKKTA